MEEYRDLELTLDAFERVLGAPRGGTLMQGSSSRPTFPMHPALQRLAAFAADRHRDGGGTIKVRLVKGANLAMERVDAAMHGWALAPYDNKADTDANYTRCLDWVLRPERLVGMRIGVASHNRSTWRALHGGARGVTNQVQLRCSRDG